MTARDRFVETRKAVVELGAIRARLSEHGEEWRPETVYVNEISDPTANQAVFNVDVLGDELERLRQREKELAEFVNVSMRLIGHVKIGLGFEYADLLTKRYIDGLSWGQLVAECNRSKSTMKRMASVSFDWIDSLGVTKILRGDYEL